MSYPFFIDNLDLDKKYQDFIIDLVSGIISKAEIFIYGSRVKEKALKSSGEISFYDILTFALRCFTFNVFII